MYMWLNAKKKKKFNIFFCETEKVVITGEFAIILIIYRNLDCKLEDISNNFF